MLAFYNVDPKASEHLFTHTLQESIWASPTSHIKPWNERKVIELRQLCQFRKFPRCYGNCPVNICKSMQMQSKAVHRIFDLDQIRTTVQRNPASEETGSYLIAVDALLLILQGIKRNSR